MDDRARRTGAARAYAAQAVARSAQVAATAERLRMARDVHDVVAHSMSLISMRAGIANHVATTHPEETGEALSIIEETSRKAQGDLRRLLGLLRDASGDQDGPPYTLDSLRELVAAIPVGDLCGTGARRRLRRSRKSAVAGRFRGGRPGDPLEALRIVGEGQALLAPSVTTRLIGEFARREPTGTPARLAAGLTRLSSREREVLVLVARGLTNPQIAERLGIGPATVKTHIRSLLAKLAVHDRAQLVIAAYEGGVVTAGG
ncbi:LuxR C-terminal-related transcriptional regulator [Microbispora amethystogenes]|nr:LuxR C-terminal-related transcriptional regulator [Microbispora amethystogenes]